MKRTPTRTADNEALRNYFSTHLSNLNDSTLQLVVRTFKTLCEGADFEDPAASEEVILRTVPIKDRETTQAKPRLQDQGNLTVNINIQLQLPATDDATVYEKLFEAMNKTILARGRQD